MSQAQLIGLAMLGAIMLVACLVALRRQPRAIRLFALMLCAMGLGYLATTPTPAEIARNLFGQL